MCIPESPRLSISLGKVTEGEFCGTFGEGRRQKVGGGLEEVDISSKGASWILPLIFIPTMSPYSLWTYASKIVMGETAGAFC